VPLAVNIGGEGRRREIERKGMGGDTAGKRERKRRDKEDKMGKRKVKLGVHQSITGH